MKKYIQITGLGNVTYEESVWLGQRKIYVDGREAKKIDKNRFETEQGAIIEAKGGFFAGVKLLYCGAQYTVVDNTEWYEILLALIPMFFALVWGNIPSLIMIFPVVGGALGGAIAGASFAVQISVLKKMQSPMLKVLLSLLMTACTVLVMFLLALLFLSAL